MAVATRYTVGPPRPTLIEHGQDTTVWVALEYDGSPASVSSATYTLVSAAGETIIDAQAATVSGGTISYDVQGTDTEDEQKGDRWREIWIVTFDGGQVSRYRREVQVTSFLYASTVGQTTLEARHHFLGEAEFLPDGLNSYQKWIDQATEKVQRALLRDGRYPDRVVNVWELHDLELAWALHLIFNDDKTFVSADDRWSELAADYKEEAEGVRLVFQYDTDDDGDIDTTTAGVATVFLGGGGA